MNDFSFFLGTQRVISFLRQMMEHGGFYRSSDQAWVKFERIQFVGACNPPTDPGRKPLSHRYIFHFCTPIVKYTLPQSVFQKCQFLPLSLILILKIFRLNAPKVRLYYITPFFVFFF